MGYAWSISSHQGDVSMSATKYHMWLILAAVVISTPDRAAAETQLIDDFSSPVWLDNWTFVPGEEFPGAKGVLIADEGAAAERACDSTSAASK
jgi:hypothetical protein